MEKPIIFIKGGNVQNIVGTSNVEIKIVDLDNQPDIKLNDLDYYQPDLCLPEEIIDTYEG